MLPHFQDTSGGSQVNESEGSIVQQVYELLNCMYRLPTPELRKRLSGFQINGRGRRKIIYERLKKYIQENDPTLLSPINGIGKTEKFFDYLIVIDFESTCDAINKRSYPHLIIEFPAVLISVREKRIVDTFRSYVHPDGDVQLSDFCTQLTGITQSDVDSAPTFLTVLEMFRKWMVRCGIMERQRYAFVTDGPWDFAKFLQMQCQKSGIPIPYDFRHYVNLRKCYFNKYHKKVNNGKITLSAMLDKLNLTFDGRQHCGLDDSKNIARIAMKLLEDNFEIRINEVLVKKGKEEQKHDLQQLKNGGKKVSYWRNHLPYKVVPVNRDSFVSGEYLEYNALECSRK